MKITKCLRLTVLSGMMLVAGGAFAYGSDSEEKKCKKPKFREFEPVHMSEVDPGTEISFHVSNWADPTTITAEARKVPMQVEVVDKMNFFVATAKLPAEVAGKYARVHVTALANEGRCLGQDGWLLKVKNATAGAKAGEGAAVQTEQAAP